MDRPYIKPTVCKVLKIFQHGKYLVAYVLNSTKQIANSNEECSFQHFSGQYKFDFLNEKILRVKVSYSQKSRLTTYVKIRIFKNGGTTFQMDIMNILYVLCGHLLGKG